MPLHKAFITWCGSKLGKLSNVFSEVRPTNLERSAIACFVIARPRVHLTPKTPKIEEFSTKFCFEIPKFSTNQFKLVQIRLTPVYSGYKSGSAKETIQDLHTKNVYYQMSKKLIL